MELLHIEHGSGSSSVYYIDRDANSRAHRTSENTVVLDSFGGTYTFDETTGKVTLFDGVHTIPVTYMIRRWLVTSD